MEKMIEVEAGKRLNFKASAFSPIIYNRLFPGRDFLRDMDALKKARDKGKGDLMAPYYEQFARIAYTFAYQGLAPTPRQTQEQKGFLEKYPDEWEWIDSFKTFSIYKILPEIAKLWGENELQISEQKNGVPAPPVK